MANQSVLELAVGTGKWDAGLKKAVQSLNNFTQANGGLTQALNSESQKMQQFVSMMGSMESSAKTAKGQMNDYKSAIEQLTMQYNRLTGAQKESFGSSYTATIDQLKVKYQAVNKELQEMTRSLNDMPTLGNEGGIFSKMGDKLGGAMSVFAGNLMTKATMEVANLGSEMAEMVKQGVEMAKAGEGIRVAFERLGNGQILNGLREATHGTVTDIELMKAAVKFNDFKLPIEELGTMLAFAQQKAKDTGQSVDYMVDSIVTGLGRKSLMILDNLGLSAAEIKEKMAETGDMTKAVGAIIREQMQKAGDYVETAADRAAQANVDLQNKLEELGRKFLPVQEASNQLWTSMKIGILDIVGGPLARLLNGLTEAGRLRNQMNDMAGGNSSSETEKQLNFLRKTSPANRQQRYDKQLGIYTQQENAAWREVNSLKGQRESFRKERLKSGARDDDWTVYADFDKKIAEAERKAKAWQNFRADYIRGAKDLIAPPKVETPKVETPKTGGSGGGTGGGRSLSAPEQADAKYVQAQKDYEQSLQQAALEVKAGTINSAEAKKKELQAAETLWKSIGDAREVYDSPKLKEAQANVESKIVALGPEVEKAIEAQKAVEKASRELEMANKKAADARAKLADAEATGELKKILPAQKAVTEADREVTRKETVLHELQEKTIKVDAVSGDVKLPEVKEEVQIPVVITATQDNIAAFLNDLKSQLGSEDIGSELYNKLTSQFADATALANVIEVATKNGIDLAQIDPQGLWSKVFNKNPGDYIDDTIWKEIETYINKELEAMDLKPIKINVNTGNVQQLGEDAKYSAKEFGKAASAVSQLGSALTQIEDPTAKVAGMIAQAIATIALTFAKSLEKTFGPWDWIAAAAAGTATMVSTITAVRSSTSQNFSEGGIVKGTSYSGDNITANGGEIGLNAGEVILTRAQQGNLAEQLEDRESISGIGGTPYVTGEQIYLGLNNYLKGAGLGQIVTSNG